MDDESRVSRLKDVDIYKIKLSLSSLTNTVVLCPVISSLYVQSTSDEETWTFMKRGVPGMILIHDGGSAITSVQICLADPDTGFAMWREDLFQRSDYKASQRNFHTFKVFSSGDGSMAGIKFPQEEVANIFLKDVLSNIPKDDAAGQLSLIKPKDRRRLSSKKIRKEEISSPCMFTHVTSMNNANQKEKSRTFSSRRKPSGSSSSLDAPNAPPAEVANGSAPRPRVLSKSTAC